MSPDPRLRKQSTMSCQTSPVVHKVQKENAMFDFLYPDTQTIPIPEKCLTIQGEK